MSIVPAPEFVLDGKSVVAINSSFDVGEELPEPHPLAASCAMSFTGTKVYGNGFVLRRDEAERISSSMSMGLIAWSTGATYSLTCPNESAIASSRDGYRGAPKEWPLLASLAS